MKLFTKIKFKKGFSIIEILVVLFIVSVSLLGVLSLLIQNIQVQNINKNNLIASSLSQEGIELIRQVRDNNWQNSRPFNTFLGNGSYVVDFQTGQPLMTSNSADFRLYLKDGLYVHKNIWDSGLTSTLFSRQIIINRLNSYAGMPLQVRSIVSWTDRNRPYRYELQTLLYDWR